MAWGAEVTTFTPDSDLSETGPHPFGTFERIRRPGAELSLSTDLPFRLGSFDASYTESFGVGPA